EAEPVRDAVIVPGRGVRGRFLGNDVWLGSHRFLEEQGCEPPEVHDALIELAASGNTVVVVGEADHVCGLIALRDVPRDGAQDVVQRLKTLGIRRIVMLTGDNRPTAEAIAKVLAIGDVRAELLPPDKVAVVEGLARTGAPVAMVGDGVNDAPAMARADLGIAMGAAGSDAAIETADIALMSDDLSRIPWLVSHSRRTVSVIRQNIGFSLLVKATFVLLAFAGRATLWSAIAADIGASLLVVFNGLRLLNAGRQDDAR
ncbi:MAG: putative cadmium-transporting ATPase, partial [Actinomycetota bacterium]